MPITTVTKTTWYFTKTDTWTNRTVDQKVNTDHHSQKNKIQSMSLTCTTVNLKQMEDLNTKPERLKLLEENTSRRTHKQSVLKRTLVA